MTVLQQMLVLLSNWQWHLYVKHQLRIVLVKKKTKEQAVEVAKFVAQFTAKSVMELNKQVKTYNAAKDDFAKQFVQKTVCDCYN